MKDSNEKLPRFSAYGSKGQCTLIIESRDEAGAVIDTRELEAYTAQQRISSDWHEIAFMRGSRLMLRPSTAQRMLEDQKIKPIQQLALVRRQDHQDQKWEERRKKKFHG